MRAHAMRALPHRPEWVIGSMLLLAGGASVLASAAGWLLSTIAMALGLAGIGLTLLKCAAYGWRSDLNGVRALTRFGPTMSRCIYRATIAALHVVQPFARSYGFVRGLVRPPKVAREGVPPAADPALAAPARMRRRPLTLLLGTGECRFWSQTWMGVDALLTSVVERLRTARFGRGVHVDDGWRSDRDISVGLGVWGWVDMRALVEDHGAGKCLCRVRLQLRLRPGTMLLLALAAVLVVFTAMRGLDALAGFIAAGGVLLLLKIVNDVARDASDIFDVVAAAADEFGMQRLGAPVLYAPGRGEPSWTRQLTRPEPTRGA
jgi:hypothetical protein